MTEYRLEARIEREPSWELMVFCLVTVGWKEEPPEEPDLREAALTIETAIVAGTRGAGQMRSETPSLRRARDEQYGAVGGSVVS